MSEHAPRIRRARPEDAPGIARVHVETWHAAYAGLVPDDYLVRMTVSGQTLTWRKVLSRTRTEERVAVAEVPDVNGVPAIVGFGSFGRQRSSDLLYSGEVFTLYVAPDWQGHGLGRRLLQWMFRGLFERGIPDCVVWVLADNPARFFYERMGGHRVAEREEAFAGQRLSETAYAWPDLEGWLQQSRA